MKAGKHHQFYDFVSKHHPGVYRSWIKKAINKANRGKNRPTKPVLFFGFNTVSR